MISAPTIWPFRSCTLCDRAALRLEIQRLLDTSGVCIGSCSGASSGVAGSAPRAAQLRAQEFTLLWRKPSIKISCEVRQCMSNFRCPALDSKTALPVEQSDRSLQPRKLGCLRYGVVDDALLSRWCDPASFRIRARALARVRRVSSCRHGSFGCRSPRRLFARPRCER